VGNHVKAKRKQKHIKVKFPKTAPINVVPEVCKKEIALLGKLSSQSSLQHAAIFIGFPTKYFGSSSSIVPHGHGGVSPHLSFIDPANSSQVILTSPSRVTTLPPSDTPPLSRLSPTTTMAKNANSPYKPLSQPSPSNNSSPAPPILQTPISTQPVFLTTLGTHPSLEQQHTPDRPSTLQANPSDPTPIVAASQMPALSHSSRMLFTYRAQLTFGLSTATEVNVTDFFLTGYNKVKQTSQTLSYALLTLKRITHQNQMKLSMMISPFFRPTMLITASFVMDN
jgi:hypothetical protein